MFEANNQHIKRTYLFGENGPQTIHPAWMLLHPKIMLIAAECGIRPGVCETQDPSSFILSRTMGSPVFSVILCDLRRITLYGIPFLLPHFIFFFLQYTYPLVARNFEKKKMRNDPKPDNPPADTSLFSLIIYCVVFTKIDAFSRSLHLRFALFWYFLSLPEWIN